MKKTRIVVATTLALATLFAPTTAANANTVDCNTTAIWTQDDDGAVKKWSAAGVLMETIASIPSRADIAITTDLSKIVTYDAETSESPTRDTLEFWNSTTGAPIGSAVTVTGDLVDNGPWTPKGLGIISSGAVLADGGSEVYSIDQTTGVATLYVDLGTTDFSPYPELGDDPYIDIAGDLLRLPNGDILAVTTNDSELDVTGFLVRISGNASPRTVTIVGSFSTSSDVYGAARAGDDIYLATANGELLRLDSVPTTPSTDAIEFTVVVTDPGKSFFGAAGSNDSTDGVSGCTLVTPRPAAAPVAAPVAAPAANPAALAKTGTDSLEDLALLAYALLIAGYGFLKLAPRLEEEKY